MEYIFDCKCGNSVTVNEGQVRGKATYHVVKCPKCK